MPIARYQLADGRIARIEVPEGTTPEQAQTMAAKLDVPPPNTLDKVYSEYPRLKQYGFQYRESHGQGGGDRHMEFYFPNTEENPFPDKSKPGIEVFDPKMTSKDVFGEMLHFLPQADEKVGGMRQQFLRGISADQKEQWLQGDYQRQAKEGLLGDNPTFEGWLGRQGGDAFFRGYLTGQYPEEAYTPQQKTLFNQLDTYLRSK